MQLLRSMPIDGVSKVQHPLDGFTKANEWRAGTVHQMEENMVLPKVSSHIRHLENMRENVLQKRAASKKSSNGYYSAGRGLHEKLNCREGSGGDPGRKLYASHEYSAGIGTRRGPKNSERHHCRKDCNDCISKLALDADEVKLLEMRSEVAELKSERSNTEARVRKYMIERRFSSGICALP